MLPHSAQLGASSWILNATFAAPSDRVTVPEPFDVLAGAAWPLAATTASSSRAGEEAPLEAGLAVAAREPVVDEGTAGELLLPAPTLGVFAEAAGEPALPDDASFTEEAVSTAALALGVSLRASDDARSAGGDSGAAAV